MASEVAELQGQLTRLAAAFEVAEAARIELRRDVERLQQGAAYRPRRRQTRRKPLTAKQGAYLEAFVACHRNNARACRMLKIRRQSGQQHLELIRKKMKAFGFAIPSATRGPAPSRATRLPTDARGGDAAPDRRAGI